MKDNIEKSLKRFLKRKAKITMGFITAFLITGNIGYALTITEDQIKDNTWTNEAEINESIYLNTVLLNNPINIINNGITNSNEFSIFNFYNDYGKNTNFGNFTNNGIINGEAGDRILNKSEHIANGIRFIGNKGNVITENIINNGLIKSNVGNLISGEDSGNGILIDRFVYDYYETKNTKIHINSIKNKNIIIGKAGNINYDSINNGNGINISITLDDKYDNKENFDGIVINNIENNGLIKGESLNFSQTGGANQNLETNTGNGIGIGIHNGDTYGFAKGPITINSFINNGIIDGKIGNINAHSSTMYNQYISNIGNGVGIYTNGDINIDNIFNNSNIKGYINNFSAIPLNVGNGIGIYSGNIGKIKIENINNTGIISGNFKQNSNYKNEGDKNLGNGIAIYAKDIELGNIENNGIIKSKANINYNKDYVNITKGIGIYAENDVNINSIINNGTIKSDGIGISINSKSGNLNLVDFKNKGLILAKDTSVKINNEVPIDGKFINFGVLNGNSKYDSFNKGVLVDYSNGNIESITNGAGGKVDGKTIINADITDKDSSISVDKETTYANNIINGAGVNSGTLNINAKTDVKDSIINAFATALKVNDGKEFSASNTTFNGGGLEGDYAVITDEGNSTISLDKSTINGNIALGSGDSKLTVTNSQINGDIKGGEGKDNLTIGGSSLYNKIDGFEDITFKGDTTLYETAKVTGANRIEIDGGTEVSLRVDSSKKADDGTYKEHALFNSSDKLLTLAGNTNAIGKDDVDKDGNLNVEENEGRVNYDKVSILNLVTSGLGLKSKIDLGNTKVDDTLWVKTDSILTQAKKEETAKGTTLTINAEKDLFSISKKFTETIPGMEIIKPGEPGGPTTTIPGMEIIKPGEPGGPTTTIPGMEIIKPGEPGGPTTTIPGMEIIKPGEPGGPTTTIPGMEIIKPGEPGGPTTTIPGIEIIKPGEPGGPTTKPTDPDKPIDPKPEPDKPQHSIKYYTKLNDIYKGIYSSNDKNFNALNNIVVNYTFSDKDKGNYPIIGNDKAQMETLLGYLNSVYTQNPYAFSNQATRKAMNLFHDSVRDNNFKANNDEWLIYGGLLHQSGDQEQTYYGRNYHGFDTGTADVDADIKLTGAYGQFEYGLSDSLATGIMVGGSKSEVEVGPSKVKGTGAYVGAYAKKDINNFRFTTGLGYQYTEYDGNRRTINETYSSDYQDQAINLYVDGKYSHNLGNNLFLEPKAGLSYTHIDQDSIKENDKALALDIEAKDFDVLEGTVGVDIKKVIPTEKGTHTLTAGISYNHILDGDNADSLRANYGGSKFDVLVPHKNKGQVSLGAKYEVELENGMFYDVKGNYYVPTDSKENSNKNADKGEWRVGVGFGYKF